MKFWSNWFLPLLSILILLVSVILIILSFRGLFVLK